MSDVPAISIRNLTVSYGTKPVLVDVSLDIPKGSVVGILGPNGAGKSTLIKSVMGFVPRDFGTVHLFGEKVDHVRGRVAYVPPHTRHNVRAGAGDGLRYVYVVAPVGDAAAEEA